MANEISNTPTPGQQPQTIPLSKIHDLPGVFNPKPVESKLGSMILSIQNSGVMEPVILRDRGDGEYQLLSGYRRRRASELAKKEDIPAFVYEMTMQEAIAYRKAVKDNPKAPIPGKLVDPAAKSKDGEKPDVTENKENGQMKIGAVDGQDKTADKGKSGEKPAEAVKDADTAEKDGKSKDGNAPAAPGDKEQPTAGKDKPDQPDTTDKGKDGEKPAEAVKDAGAAEKDGKGKDGEAPTAPGEKEQTTAGKDKPDQPNADKSKGDDKPAEDKGEAEHKPTVAELEAKAKAGEPFNLSELVDAQKREREAQKAADKGKDQKQTSGRGRPKSTLRPTDTEAEKLKKGVAEKEADAPALEAAVKGSASTAIKQVLEDRLEPPTEDSLKSIPVPGDGESIFVTLHPAYLEKSPLNTFSVDTESENFKELCKSIELVGIKDPVLARFNTDGKLEILSGQRRHLAATTLNRAVPTIIQKIDDADAKILVADGNLHRDKISSYDLSRALRMKMEGMKQKAGRRKKGYAAAELQSDAKLAQEMGMSVPKLNRYIHLSEAVKGVCDLVDDGKLTVSVASEIAYLKKGTQQSVLHLMDLGYKPTNERVQRIKRAENEGKKPDEMMLRNILDDKDIAPKQQTQAPQTQAPQQNGAAAQSAPAAEAPQQSSAPAPETIPTSPDVAAQTPSGTDAPAHVDGTEQKPDAPTAGVTDAAKSDAENDPFEGKQERPEVTKVILTGDRLRKYFPDVTMTPRAIEESIYAALEERRQRQLHQQQKPNLRH